MGMFDKLRLNGRLEQGHFRDNFYQVIKKKFYGTYKFMIKKNEKIISNDKKSFF